jgi:hypothetical protein
MNGINRDAIVEDVSANFWATGASLHRRRTGNL